MKKFFILTILMLHISQMQFAQNVDKQSITGSWLGGISAGAANLRVIFNLSIIEKDSLIATMDSPDQGAKNIKLGLVKFDGKEIKIMAPLMLGEYTGILQNDTLIKGTWSQAGRSAPLDLVRLKSAFTLNRPQEPKPPFPYSSEDVIFTNEKACIELAGTLTIPEGNGPFPGLILITGSGAQNRNEEIMGHKPFWVIADYLTRNGIAVLRYDDRGVGMSKGSPLNSTSADFATDAEAAFLYLKTRKEINPASVGLAGHSEGGLIAPVVAADNPDIAFIISLAGPGVPGEQILYRQGFDISVASGMDEDEVNEGITINKKIYSVIKKETDNQKALEKSEEVYKKLLVKKGESDEEIETALKQFHASMPQANLAWFRYFIKTDPSVFWKRVKCPVLALNGENDLQVAYDVNLPAIEKTLKKGGNRSVTIKSFPGLNHLFQNSKTGLPAEYGEIEETFSPEVLQVMTEWIHDLR